MSGNWKDAYEAQMDLWKWIRTQEGRDQLFSTTDYDELEEQTRTMVTDLIRSEEPKLLTADPFFVASEFSDLIEMAKDGFVPEPLLASDFLSPQGFLFYEKPITIPTRDPGRSAALVGFSWAPMMMLRGEHDAGWPIPEDPRLVTEDSFACGMALTLYERLPEDDRVVVYRDTGREIHLPPICPMHITPWYFGMSFDGNEIDTQGAVTAVDAWWQTCQVTLRLMQQKLAARTGTQVERSSRRRGARLGFAPREVVVVRLRRHKAAPTGEERDVQWTHRWYSGPYWRATWYPSLGVHRQQYVQGSIKGPEALPLVLKGRAYQWEE